MAASLTVTCQDKKPLRDEPSLSSGPPAGCRFAFAGVTTASAMPFVLLLLSRSSNVTHGAAFATTLNSA
jgi:hypothetical protein